VSEWSYFSETDHSESLADAHDNGDLDLGQSSRSPGDDSRKIVNASASEPLNGSEPKF